MKSYLWSRYKEAKRVTKELVPSIMSNMLNPDAIFSNNEMSLSDIEIYGFDYDYTLVFYSKHLHTLIFNAARDLLINEHRYPGEIRKYDYDPNFAIRGLHYDVHRALLMKIDAFHYIQLGTVYRGLSVVPDEEVIAMYDGSHVPLEQMSDFYGKSSQGNTMKQFMDIFSLPEMMLLSCVNEYFLKNNIDYEPVHLYKDVKDSIRDVHIKGIMYRAIEADIEKYICYAEQTRAVLAKLADHGKKMFLITNSPSSFVDKGMKFIVGKDWRDLFDVVIVQADKPNFFNDKRRPFRKVNERGVLLWDKIHKLQKGQIYKQGNLYEFLKLTGWRGSKVLYFGDHIYSDLADLTLKHGWRTGAIIPELRSEIKTMNTEKYIQTMTWLQTLTGLLEHMQVHRDPDSQMILEEWKKERKELRTDVTLLPERHIFGAALEILKHKISRKRQQLEEKKLLGGNEKYFKRSELAKKEEEAYFQRCGYKHLRKIEILAPEVNKGLRNDLKAALDKIDRQYLNEIVGGQEGGDDDSQNDLEVHKENTTIEELEALGESLGHGDDHYDVDIITKFLKFLLGVWAKVLNAREDYVKRGVQGKLNSATQKQTESYWRLLFSKLWKRTLPADIKESITDIIKYMLQVEYVKANNAYLQMAFGNAPWPIGVTMVGIHARTGREISKHVAHVLNDKTQRKYIQGLKRLMIICQKHFLTDPSKCVEYNSL
ncbi:5'-nucleotidase domain-containing protein 3 [Willisornis vidua]|uniref:5'-nucleotidase domain-containing protein 3 n=1 Tax=Willisornis vidua TaxID=1566151 RepID=A0ABQ9D4B7_9PASS|nr:5'-nucleotidase domain-containing protein 3 [Willisornis vidua]